MCVAFLPSCDETNFALNSMFLFPQAAPFKKDFSVVITYKEHPESEYAAYREAHNIIVSGDQVPNPILDFDEINFGPAVMSQLR